MLDVNRVFNLTANTHKNTHFYFQDLQGQRKGAKLAGLAEQRIIIPGVGLAVESHGEEGRSAAVAVVFFVLFFFLLRVVPDESLLEIIYFVLLRR